MAPDDGIELVVARRLRQIAAELVEDGRPGLLPFPGASADADGLLALEARDELVDLRAHARHVRAEFGQNLRGDAVGLTRQAEQEVFGSDVGVAELEAFAHSVFDDLLGARREGDVARRGLLPLADDLDDLSTHLVKGDVQGLQRLGSNAFALADEAEKNVFCAEVVVLEIARLILRKHDHPASTVGEPFEHWYSLRDLRRRRCVTPQRCTRCQRAPGAGDPFANRFHTGDLRTGDPFVAGRLLTESGRKRTCPGARSGFRRPVAFTLPAPSRKGRPRGGPTSARTAAV